MAATVLSHSTEASILLPLRHPAGRTNRRAVRSPPQPRAGSSTAISFVTPISTIPRKHPVPIPFRHPGTYATRPLVISQPSLESTTPPSSSDVSCALGATPVAKRPQRRLGTYSNRPTVSSVAPTPETTTRSPESVHVSAHAVAPNVFNPTQPASPPFRSRFHNRTRSAYLGTSSVIIIPTARTPVVAVRAVRKDRAMSEPAQLPAAAPSAHDSPRPTIPLRRALSTGSFMQRATVHDEELEDETTSLLGAHRPIASQSLSAFGLPCIRYGDAPPSETGGDYRSPPDSKFNRERPISGHFHSVEVEDADLEEMPEVREALHVNARICAMGYRYERAVEVVA
ncbi:hypothetical protein C8R45DRAFT_1013274 [Mycena sanguinolenta]|nr:hypothetical protein C8R45DRAFT_1013274 [Mycena sanguinolenta]